ncbi:MAG TPA: hypothetical protein VFC07_03200, partial [Verrucomicrobiae bacterium]|nr:hypothetical protein [Verrucomicrobiae bacterium]
VGAFTSINSSPFVNLRSGVGIRTFFAIKFIKNLLLSGVAPSCGEWKQAGMLNRKKFPTLHQPR